MAYLRRRRRRQDISSLVPARLKGSPGSTLAPAPAAAVGPSTSSNGPDPRLTSPVNLIALQRRVGNRRVVRLLVEARPGAAPRAAGPRPPRTTIPATGALAPAVQRNGPYELDFGTAPPTSPTSRKLAQDHRLRALARWLTANRTKLAWLGLFDRDKADNAALAEGVEWATTHIEMWLAADETLDDDVWGDINRVSTLATAWLTEHEGARYKDIDATAAEARDLGLDWAAKAIHDKKHAIEGSLADGSPLYWKTVNAEMRTLDRWATSWRPLLGAVRAAMDEYERIRLDYVEILDQVEEEIKSYPTLYRRSAHVTSLSQLRPKLEAIALRFTRLTAAPKGDPDAEGLKRIEVGILAAIKELRVLHEPIYELGGAVEDAVSRLPIGARGAGKGQRTSLPTVTATIVGQQGLPTCEMLVQAVKDAKSPAWKQAAFDFALGNLATGRPDHIHICGGGNTLIYRGRLIRGFIAVHLDTRQLSQALANKVKGRDTSNPVRVAAYNGAIHEVVPG